MGRGGIKIIGWGSDGENLNILKPISSLAATGTGFIYYHQNTKEPWDVIQENSIDKEDRIAFAIEKVTKLVQESVNLQS